MTRYEIRNKTTRKGKLKSILRLFGYEVVKLSVKAGEEAKLFDL